MYWITYVGPLTKEAWISKILKTKNWHLFDFISTIRLWNRHDLWNMRVDSRTRKIVKQKEHRSSLQNLDRSDINTSRHFLKSWAAGGNTVDLRRKNKQYSNQLGGTKKMIKWWISEAEDNGAERKIIRWTSIEGKLMAD
jgi:hypothetical protein